MNPGLTTEQLHIALEELPPNMGSGRMDEASSGERAILCGPGKDRLDDAMAKGAA
jgi:hypothetical protein